MKKSLQGLAATVSILLLGWSVYYGTSSAPSPDAAATTPLAPAASSALTKDDENSSTTVAVARPSATKRTTNAASSEMHLAEPHPPAGKLALPESEPVDLANQSMSIKKDETKSREILPGVTIRGGGVNVNLDKDDSRTLEVRPHSQTQLTLKQKF